MRKLKHKGLFLLALAVVALVLAVPAFKDVFGVGGNNTGVYLEIRSGETLGEIAQELKDEGIIKYRKLFTLYAKGKYPAFQYGGHVFTTDMSYSQVCAQLSEFGTSENVRVVIPEGYELRLIAKACEDVGLVSAKSFMKCADEGDFDYDFVKERDGVEHRLEGFLFPATYEFSYGMTAHDIIDTMLAAFDRVYTAECKKRAAELGMTDYDVITLASVIEREAANATEHKKVSGVFYNRINNNMRLQSCATVQYILKDRKPVLSIADTEIDSLYNTYKYDGLPVGPIASPGESAILAALYPEKHDYYFFVAKSDLSGHVFSKTFEEHNRAVQQNQ